MIANIIKYFKIEILKEISILRKQHSERWAKTPFDGQGQDAQLLQFFYSFLTSFVFWPVLINQ